MNLEQAKNWFFDDPKVIARVEKSRLRALSRFGAFVRTSARTSMRRRRNPSPPGTPPSVQSRDSYATLRNILFAYDAATDSVIVGPILLASTRRNRRFTVPELHEKGGSVAGDGRLVEVRTPAGRDARGRRIPAGTRKVRLDGRLKYPKRPFMVPALERVSPKFADQFAGNLE